MGWETKNGHRYYVIHRKAFGGSKPVYGGSGESGRLAEREVLEERAAWRAIRDETLQNELQAKECEALLRKIVEIELTEQGFIYTRHRRWILASKIRGQRGPYKSRKDSSNPEL